MITVSLKHGRVNLATGDIEYDNEDDYEQDKEIFNAAKVPKLLEFFTDGTVKIRGREVKLTPTHRTILFCLRTGKCSRLDVMNEVIPESRQLTMKDPENAMYQHIFQLKTALSPFGIAIKADSTHYILKEILGFRFH